jgi:coronin-1B/1C/6
MSSSEWFDGKTAVPPMISLKGRYDGGEANEVPAQPKPKEVASSTSLPPTKTQVEAPKPAAAPVPQQPVVERGPPPSVKENKQSIETMASKYADKFEDSDDEDDASSFEEVAKPVERPSRVQEPAKPSPAPAPTARSVQVQRQEPTSVPKPASPKQSSPPADMAPSSSVARPTSALAEGLKTHLSDIKSAQADALSEMADLKSQVSTLTELVKHLSGRLDSFMGSQSERMRQVELEVEGMRE